MTLKLNLNFFLTLFPILLIGQNNHISIGAKGHGICIGNSAYYNGLRFNFRDRDVMDITGINLSGQAECGSISGISIGIVGSFDSIVNGLQIGGFAAVAKQLTGVSVSPGMAIHENVNGLVLSGLKTYFKKVNGVEIGIFGPSPLDSPRAGRINGLGIGGISFYCNEVNGVSAAAILGYPKKIKGVSIAVLNITEELHGIQFGLFNYAKNNPVLFRLMPVMNCHFGRGSVEKYHATLGWQ